MTDLEVFRLSAKACGYYEVPHSEMPPVMWGMRCFVRREADRLVEWNPFTDAEQRWECVRKLLENYGVIIFADFSKQEYHEWYRMDSKEMFSLKCPAEEFPARCLAELESMESQS